LVRLSDRCDGLGGEYRTIATMWGVEKGMIDKSVINGATRLFRAKLLERWRTELVEVVVHEADRPVRAAGGGQIWCGSSRLHFRCR
jgi:hypothetical protein